MDLVKKGIYLYDRNGSDIGVYSFEPQKEALIEYRRKLIQAQNQNELFNLVTSDSKRLLQMFVDGNEISYESFKYNYQINFYNSPSVNASPEKRAKDKKTQDQLLDQYINDGFSHIVPTVIISDDSKNVSNYAYSFLALNKDIKTIYSLFEDDETFRLYNVLKLPPELALLQLLETGTFESLVQSRMHFDEQIAMFETKKVGSISDDELKRADEFCLIPGTYERVKQKILTTQEVLKRIPIIKS